MQLSNQQYPGRDVLCVFALDPDTGNPQSSHTNTDVTLGNVPGVSAFSFSGIKNAVSDVAMQRVEAIPTVLAPMAGVGMFVASDNAADVGVQIRITAVGPNGAYMAPMVVTLQGTTPIALGTLSRINSMYRLTGDIVGTVTVKDVGGTSTYGFMEPGAQIMRSASFTIPVGYRLAIQTVIGAMLKSGGSDAGVVFSLRFKPMASNSFGSIIALASYRAGNSQIQAFQEYSAGTTGPFDVEVVAQASTAGCDAQVYVSGILVDTSIHP